MRVTKVLLGSLIAIAVISYCAIVFVFVRKTAEPPPPSPETVIFRPPSPEAAPESIRDAVMLGYHIMNDTPTYAKAYVGNGLTCSNCHFNAGLSQEGISLVGVAAVYPKYRRRTKYATDLVARTNECFERSMNGHAAPVTSREMQALQAYFAWISRDIPIYSKVPWLGLSTLTPERPADPANGEAVFHARCTGCHGNDGEGTEKGPPLWGPKSFNDGAGMSKQPVFASFVYANMPLGSHDLSIEQAFDVAGYVATKPRPHFDAKKQE